MSCLNLTLHTARGWACRRLDIISNRGQMGHLKNFCSTKCLSSDAMLRNVMSCWAGLYSVRLHLRVSQNTFAKARDTSELRESMGSTVPAVHVDYTWRTFPIREPDILKHILFHAWRVVRDTTFKDVRKSALAFDLPELQLLGHSRRIPHNMKPETEGLLGERRCPASGSRTHTAQHPESRGLPDAVTNTTVSSQSGKLVPPSHAAAMCMFCWRTNSR